MIHAATLEIQKTFDEKKIPYRIDESENNSSVVADLTVGEDTFAVRFVSSNDDMDVCVRLWSLVKATEDKCDAVLDMIRRLNNHFRHVKFILDNENEVDVVCDLPLSTEGVGPICYEIFLRYMDIIRMAYPELKAILPPDTDEEETEVY